MHNIYPCLGLRSLYPARANDNHFVEVHQVGLQSWLYQRQNLLRWVDAIAEPYCINNGQFLFLCGGVSKIGAGSLDKGKVSSDGDGRRGRFHDLLVEHHVDEVAFPRPCGAQEEDVVTQVILLRQNLLKKIISGAIGN